MPGTIAYLHHLGTNELSMTEGMNILCHGYMYSFFGLYKKRGD